MKNYLILFVFLVILGQMAVARSPRADEGSEADSRISIMDLTGVGGMQFAYIFSIYENAENGPISLSGVHVRLVADKKDTINLFTKNGMAAMERQMQGDSVDISISCLGYKTINWKQKISNTPLMFNVEMEVDPFEISSIIVKGEQIAMVVRGDTTIYNAGAFKTMQGDALAELLRKLPGIDVRDGQIYAEGAPVKRILVNGTTLFGDMVDRAAELLLADDIKDVKIYDRHSEQDVAIGDTLKAKDKVIDVTTKTKKTKVSAVFLNAYAGVYLDKNASGKYEPMYAVRAQTDRHMVGNNIFANLAYGSKMNLLERPTKNYTDELSAQINWSTTSKDKKFSFETSARVDGKCSDTYSGSTYDYFPAPEYSSRIQSSISDVYDRFLDVSSRNNIRYKFDERNSTTVYLDVLYKHKQMDSRAEDRMSIDGTEAYSSNMARYDKGNNLGVNSRIYYWHNFAKPKRNFNSGFEFKFSDGSGNQWSVDTLQSSSQKVYLTNDKNTRGYNYGGSIYYNEPLSEKWNMYASYTINQKRDKSQRFSIDRLTGLPDLTNSHDYSNNLLDNDIRLGFMQTDKWGSLELKLDVRSILQKRDETVPDATFYSKHYLHVAPSLDFRYSKKSYFLNLQYNEEINVPSIEQLRSNLNTYNAPFYTAGNPSLKATIMRSLSFLYSLTDVGTAGTLKFQTSFKHFRNQIVYKDIFFTSAGTYEGFGDFVFPAGSTLQTAANATGQMSVGADAEYSVRLKHLQSVLRTTLHYGYDRTPYYLYENLYINNGNTANLDLRLITNFSRIIELTFMSRTGLGQYDKDVNSKMKEISEIAGCMMRLNFAKRMWLVLNGEYRFRNTTVENTRIDEVVLDAELSVTFGKENRGRIGLHGNDLLNQVRSLSVTMMDDYTRTRIDRILGRNVYLSFSYRF